MLQLWFRDSMRTLANELREKKGPAALIELLFEKARKVGEDAIIESVRTEVSCRCYYYLVMGV